MTLPPFNPNFAKKFDFAAVATGLVERTHRACFRVPMLN